MGHNYVGMDICYLPIKGRRCAAASSAYGHERNENYIVKLVEKQLCFNEGRYTPRTR